ncbi:hypothetical protein J8F10_16145 [Gemmata sp. G18]|uniref:Lipoprotein n=1 Tax=Gemmata palustris TaxID=2822762 RepID=A0ABS5BT16_9BACT|nr:hypothetical protein [Gemmata palustris]MBP3956805.1 hypothetical protein [Gemmata palustris]
MRAFASIPLLLATALVAGCGGCSGQPAPGAGAVAVEPSAAPSGPMFDTLEYANWKRFPVGTTVKRKLVTSTERSTNKVTSVNTYTLRTLGSDGIEVTRQNTTDRGDGTPPTVNSGETNRFARQFAIPNGMTADDFNKPSRKAKVAGEEDVTVLGKKYKTTIYSWSDSTEAGPLEVKLWLSEEMPGRIVKQVMKQSTLANTTSEEVVEVTIPKS